MPLQRGEVQGYDFNRMAVEFTMVNQGKAVPCSISTAAMDEFSLIKPANKRLTIVGVFVASQRCLYLILSG
jgi:hypothetical protein